MENKKDIDFSIIIDRIKMLIGNKNLNFSEFANAIGENPAKLSHIFNGRNNPTLSIIMKIHSSFPDISVNWLLGLDDENMASKTPSSVKDNRFNGIINFDDSVMDEGHDIGYNSKSKDVADDNGKVAYLKPDLNTSLKNKSVTKVIVYYNDNTFEEISK